MKGISTNTSGEFRTLVPGTNKSARSNAIIVNKVKVNRILV